jgi:hypothetical protein
MADPPPAVQLPAALASVTTAIRPAVPAAGKPATVYPVSTGTALNITLSVPVSSLKTVARLDEVEEDRFEMDGWALLMTPVAAIAVRKLLAAPASGCTGFESASGRVNVRTPVGAVEVIFWLLAPYVPAPYR